MGSNHASTVDVPILVSVSWPKSAFLKLLWGNVHCCDEKSTCPSKDLVSFDESAVKCVPKLEDRMVGSLFWMKIFVMDN